MCVEGKGASEALCDVDASSMRSWVSSVLAQVGSVDRSTARAQGRKGASKEGEDCVLR